MGSKASETVNQRKRTINTVLLFLIGPFKANSEFAYLFAVSYSMYQFEIDTEFVDKNTLGKSNEQYTRSAKWNVEELICNLP